jgi:hypothetical protein
MSGQIKRFAPKLSADVMTDNYDTIQQQFAFADIALASLYAGLTNVLTFTLDDLGTIYKGLYEFPIMLHEVGHNKDTNGTSALSVRAKQQTHHMKVVDALVKGLKQFPEGKGSMFDNTIITYFPENGETHHSLGTEVPLLILAGDNVKLNIAGRYIRLPNYNEPGHKTLGNWYTTILNAYGNPIKHYGDPDVGLKIDQFGAIRPLMA